jgi:hypothetical protein
MPVMISRADFQRAVELLQLVADHAAEPRDVVDANRLIEMLLSQIRR